jgi:hypothetical protein
MNTFLYNNRKKILIGIISLIIIGGAALLYSIITFRVMSVSPNTNQAYSPSTQAIIVTFNKSIKSIDGSISASNNLQTTNTIKGGNLTLNIPDGLIPNSSYIITIPSVTAADGSVLKNIKLSFKTNNDSNLSRDQLKIALQRQQNSSPSAYNDPLYKALPYSSGQYAIQAHVNTPTNTTDNSSVGIEITVYLNRDQEGDNRIEAIQSIEGAALAHLQSIHNVNLDNYNIDYIIQDPLT